MGTRGADRTFHWAYSTPTAEYTLLANGGERDVVMTSNKDNAKLLSVGSGVLLQYT